MLTELLIADPYEDVNGQPLLFVVFRGLDEEPITAVVLNLN